MNSINIKFEKEAEIVDFVNKVNKYPYDMDLSRGSCTIDAKSILGALGIGAGSVLKLSIHEEEYSEVLNDIKNYIVDKNL